MVGQRRRMVLVDPGALQGNNGLCSENPAQKKKEEKARFELLVSTRLSD